MCMEAETAGSLRSAYEPGAEDEWLGVALNKSG